jgi:hypothetical protein
MSNRVPLGGKRLLAEAGRLRKLLNKQIDGCDRLEAKLSRSETALNVKGQSIEAIRIVTDNQFEIRHKLREARINIAQSQALADMVEKSTLKVR